ncbi:MAG: exodeoxyribonuclease VII small subunit [Clostridia bacterium]|nr:exodeoxyribonuclease VII small subunit [Clostridia bacterium]
MDKNDRNGGTSAEFEKKIAELQKIADKLESDAGISLEDSMRMFEDGLALTKECVDSLGAVQSKINELNKQLDGILRQPLFGDGNE